MDNLSIEMKKILYIALQRTSQIDIRILTTKENYLPTIEEWLNVQRALEKELLEIDGKLPR